MIVGIPKEVKDAEKRVSVVPAGVEELTRTGHRVLVEMGAGLGSGIGDDEYGAAGATLIASHERVFAEADLIVKVKEPQPEEYGLFRSGQTLFTYLHLAPLFELTKALMERNVLAVAYETIQLPDGSLPLLVPMSEVAGRMAVQVGAQYLESPNGGRGVLLGGIPGVPPAEVVIIGAGTVGTQAAKMALGLGAHVTLLDRNPNRLRYLDDILHGNFITVVANSHTVARAVSYADLLIGAVLIPGAKAPRIVSETMVKSMKEGSVIVDVAIDQGGSIETVDRATTHRDPIYVKYGVIHYSVANIPGAVPRTSTYGLTNTTLPYVLELAAKGPIRAIKENPALAKGVNVMGGQIVHEAVAAAHGLPMARLSDLL